MPGRQRDGGNGPAGNDNSNTNAQGNDQRRVRRDRRLRRSTDGRSARVGRRQAAPHGHDGRTKRPDPSGPGRLTGRGLNHLRHSPSRERSIWLPTSVRG